MLLLITLPPAMVLIAAGCVLGGLLRPREE
jgi:hypothetical protein